MKSKYETKEFAIDCINYMVQPMLNERDDLFYYRRFNLQGSLDNFKERYLQDKENSALRHFLNQCLDELNQLDDRKDRTWKTNILLLMVDKVNLLTSPKN